MVIDWTKVIITADDDTVAMAAGQVILLASGVPGESASVEVVETVTLDPLEDADVENVGDSRNVKLKLKIPRGQSGVWGGIGGTLEDQADLKQALDAKADIIHTSASGSLVHITDGAAYPVDALTVGIDPVQDLHGYDSPWPAGGGKNLYGGEFDTLFELHLQSGQTITAYTDVMTKVEYYASDGVTRIDYWTLQSITGGYAKTFTLSADAYYFKFVDNNSGTPTKMYIAVENSFSGYSPYSNVCPISGHSSATVTRTGKNLLQITDFSYGTLNDVTFEELEDGGIWVHGTASANARRAGTINTPVYKDIAYTFGKWKTQQNINVNSFNAAILKSNNSYTKIASTNNQSISFTAEEDGVYSTFAIFVASGTQVDNVFYPQLELGSSATAYESPHIQSLTISLGGTRYGGTLNVLTGTLTVDRVSVTWNSKTGWNYRGSDGIFSTTSNVPDYKKSGKHYTVTDNAISNWTTVYDQSGGWADTAIDTVGIYSSTNDNDHVVYIRPSGGTFTTVDELDTYLSGNPLQVVFTLATPTVITGLTPETISLLLGENNVWSDTGNTAIGYRADTKLYIDSKLAAAIAELQALILEH